MLDSWKGVHYEEYFLDSNELETVCSKELITLFVQRGFSMDIRTAFKEACRAGRSDIVKVFFDFSEEFNREFCLEKWWLLRWWGIILTFFSFCWTRFVQLPQVHWNEETLFRYLILDKKKDRKKIIEFLIDSGVNVNAKIQKGRTGEFATRFFLVLRLNRLEIIECLLELKTDIKPADRHVYLLFIFQTNDGDVNSCERSGVKLVIASIALSKEKFRGHFASKKWPEHWGRVQSLFDECRLELDHMKTRMISIRRKMGRQTWSVKM